MTPEELNLAKYELDLRRLRFDRAKAKREQGFLFRHSAVLISGILSLATVAVSVASVLNARQTTRQMHDLQLQETERKAAAEAQATARAVNELDRKGSLELLQYVTSHYDLIFSNQSDKQVRIRNAMQLAFPPAPLKHVFEQLAEAAPTKDGPNVWQQDQRREDATNIREPLQRRVGGGSSTPPKTQQEILAALTGVNRRATAEWLARLEEKEAAELVELLTTSLLEQTDRWSYRYNLYAAYTLAHVPGGWLGTPTQLAAIRALQNSGNYRDATFRNWVDRAIKNHKPQA